MKHINKQLEVNLNLLEPNNSGPNRKSNTEAFNISFLILLGCAGLYLYSQLFSPEKPSNPFSTITTNATLTSNDQSLTPAFDSKSPAKERLEIRGVKEAGEKVVISIDAFDSMADYRIDFGDGDVQVVNSKEVDHVYKNAGRYEVILVVSYQNDQVNRVKKKIRIKRSIEVIPEAFVEK